MAAASGSQPIDGLAPLTQVGGDLTELLERAEPDVVLNAVVGFAGLPATLWALEHGVDARAREQGEPRRGRRARARGAGAGRRAAAPGRQRALGRVPVPRGPRAGAGRLARAHRLGRPVPRAHARGARGRHAGGGARASDLEHGPEDHDRLGDAREQGARADRGALPLRPPVRADRGRAPADLGRPRARALPRRRLARAPRLPGHARADLLRADLSRARGDARCRRSTSRRASCSSSSRPTWRRSRCSRSRAGPASDGGTYPCAFNAANEVAVAAFLEGRLPFLGDRRDRRGDAGRGRRRARARPGRAGRGRQGSAPARGTSSRSHERPRRHPRPRAADPDPRGGPLLHRARASACGRGSSTSASRRRSSSGRATGSSTGSARSRSAAT